MKELDYKQYRILLVDDELSNLENLIFAFELDFNLITASSAAEALAVMDKENITVVISDQRMPEMSGVELLARIKNIYPKVVRILITAYSDIEAAIDGVNKGHIYRYIRKDLDMRDIESIIKQAIECFQMREDVEIATQHLIKSEKLITIAEMAAGIGHEIKNTITGVNLGLDLLKEKFRRKGIEDPDLTELVSKIWEYGRRSADIVQRLHDFAKPGHVEHVDLYKVVNDSIEMAKDGLKRILTNTVIRNELSEGIPPIPGNSVHFEEIFLNLIRNACQAMEETGGQITVDGKADGKWVRIAVRDTGPGIPKENQRRVFGAFYTTKKDGMGMGLYIIDQIAKTFGGRLELESELGKGTTFTVVLPVDDPKH